MPAESAEKPEYEEYPYGSSDLTAQAANKSQQQVAVAV